MSKKHFQALAEAFQSNKPASIPTAVDRETRIAQTACREQWVCDVRAVAAACAQSNGRFDFNRFYLACGFGEEEK
jgi:hypothetical protein